MKLVAYVYRGVSKGDDTDLGMVDCLDLLLLAGMTHVPI